MAWAVFAGSLSTALPLAAQSGSAKTSSPDNGYQVTLIGCVQPEKDYRADLGAKKGGPLGSGAGQGNEYVLVKAKPAPGSGDRASSREAVATAGQQGDYLLTGKTEDELKRAIGRQIEVVGVVQAFRANESAKEDRDRLPRLTISTWHPVQDYCPAAGAK
jgi:hypothetical protein